MRFWSFFMAPASLHFCYYILFHYSIVREMGCFHALCQYYYSIYITTTCSYSCLLLYYTPILYIFHIVPYAYEESLLCISTHSSEIRSLCSIMQCSLRNARKFAIYFVRIFPKLWQILKHISLEYFIKHKSLISEEYIYTLYHYYIYVNVMILLSLLRLYYHYI